MSIIDTLVTDRTKFDVANGTAKGYYNSSDMNRVAHALIYVRDRLVSAGYDVNINPKNTWTSMDSPSESDWKSYLGCVETIRSVLEVVESTPKSPKAGKSFTYVDANNIEQIVSSVEDCLACMQKVYMRSGSFVSFSGVGYYIDRSADYIVLHLLCDSEGTLIADADGIQLAAG